MNLSITILIIVIFALMGLLWMLKTQFKKFEFNYHKDMATICEMSLTLAKHLDDLNGKIRNLEEKEKENNAK